MADVDEDRIPAIALPAGSFELRELRDALDTAVGVKDRETHPERINKAIANTIKSPETLANLDSPAVPTGASLVKQPITYVEGQEPVEREVAAFDPVKAEDGTEAAGMRYEERGEKVVATDEPAGAPPPTEDAAATLSEQAGERLEEDTSAASSRSGGRRK